jgi:hypothetical protein
MSLSFCEKRVEKHGRWHYRCQHTDLRLVRIPPGGSLSLGNLWQAFIKSLAPSAGMLTIAIDPGG